MQRKMPERSTLVAGPLISAEQLIVNLGKKMNTQEVVHEFPRINWK